MLFPCDLPGGTKKSAFHPRRTESFLADMRKSFEKRAAKNDGPHKNSRQEPEKRRKTSKIPLVGQASAALCAAASQHLAAVRGRHSLAETMFLAALTLLRLVSSQHLSSTSYYNLIPWGTGTGPNYHILRRFRHMSLPVQCNLNQYLL